MGNPTGFRRLVTLIGLSLALVATSYTALAQRTGDSARITVGIVERGEQVPLKSNVNRNALIGGAVGWALTRNRSRERPGDVTGPGRTAAGCQPV